jgi:ribonucleoside-diphosphate reductase beta chain
VPRRIIIGLLSSAAYNGSRFKSPFNFEHFTLREITITANGRNYPQVPYQLDYARDLYVRAFHDFNEFVGVAYTTESNGIDMNMYKSGWCLYTFCLTNSMENENCFELIKDGIVGINLKFIDPVPAGSITLIAYAESDTLLLVDRNRQISSDLSV